MAAVKFFNADWRKQEPRHYCQGPHCCCNELVSVRKGIILATRMARSLRPPIFSRSNWTAWSSSLHWFGFATGFHQGLLLQAATMAMEQKEHGEPVLGGHVGSSATHIEASDTTAHPLAMPDIEGHELDNMLNETDMYREEQTKTLRISLELLKTDPRALLRQVWLLRIPLEPQRRLMQHLTHWTSSGWEEEQLKNYATAGHRQFRPLELHRQSALQDFFKSVMRQFCDQDVWQFFPQNECLRSDLLKMTMRSAAWHIN